MWEALLAFMIKFSFISLIAYGAIKSLISTAITAVYGGKMAVKNTKQG